MGKYIITDEAKEAIKNEDKEVTLASKFGMNVRKSLIAVANLGMNGVVFKVTKGSNSPQYLSYIDEALDAYGDLSEKEKGAIKADEKEVTLVSRFGIGVSKEIKCHINVISKVITYSVKSAHTENMRYDDIDAAVEAYNSIKAF